MIFRDYVVGLVIAIFLFGCISGINNLPIKLPGVAAACANQFTDQNNGYSICLQRGWTSKIVDNQYMLAEGDSGESSVIIWPLVLGGSFRGISALRLTNYIVGQVKQQYPDFTVLNISSTADKTVVEVVATYSDEKGKRYRGVLTTFLDPNGNGFLTGYETLDSNFNKKEEELRGIVASYKILKPASTANAQGDLANYQSPGGEFTMQIPRNWQVTAGGSCATLAIRAIDPQNPVRQVFAFTELGPIYYDAQVKQQKDEYYATCRQLGATCPGEGTIDVLPLVANVNAETFLTQAVPALGSLDIIRRIFPAYPQMSSIQVTSREPLPQDINNALAASGLQLDGGTFYANFIQNGVNAKGKFLVVVTYFSYVGLADGGPVYGISAPQQEFDSLEPTLVKSAQSIKLGDAYVQNCQAQQRAQGEAQKRLANTLSETSDIITKGWEARQKVQDRVSEKWSDTILGRDRVYNPDHGEVYSVSNGFYDYYNTHRDQYEFKNMRELTPEEYKEVPLDGQLHIR